MGIACLLALPALLMPMSALEACANLFAAVEFPRAPLFAYLLRAALATYAAVGVFYVILAVRPEKYPVLVPFSGVAAVYLGVALAIVGGITGLPALWFVPDALFSIVLGVLILLFWGRARGESGRAASAGEPAVAEPEEEAESAGEEEDTV
jgi:hypothetical protein